MTSQSIHLLSFPGESSRTFSYIGNRGIGPTNILSISNAISNRKDNLFEILIISLWSNNLQNEGIQKLIPSFAHCPNLTKLHLQNNLIGDEGVVAISDWLCTNQTLQELDLEDNCFGSKGTKSLALMLRDNSSLQVLKISKNSIRGCGVEDEGMHPLSHSLLFNFALQTLIFNENEICQEIQEFILTELSFDCRQKKKQRSLEVQHKKELIWNLYSPSGGKRKELLFWTCIGVIFQFIQFLFHFFILQWKRKEKEMIKTIAIQNQNQSLWEWLPYEMTLLTIQLLEPSKHFGFKKNIQNFSKF